MQGSLLLPPPFVLPLPVGSSINLMLLTLLDVFPPPSHCQLELCQCHSLLQSGENLPPAMAVPALVPLRPFPELTAH